MKRFSLALLFSLLIGAASAQLSGGLMFPGPGMPAASGGAPVLALDGNSGGINNSTGTLVAALTTVNGSGVIVVGVITNGSVSTITASGLTFTKRGTTVVTGTANVEQWTASYTTNFSGNITVTMATAVFTTVNAWGVSGTKSSSFFDAGGPATSTTTNPSITTTNANDFIYAVMTSGGSASAAAPWILLSGANFGLFMYQIVSATGTYTPAESVGASSGGIVDALQRGP